MRLQLNPLMQEHKISDFQIMTERDKSKIGIETPSQAYDQAYASTPYKELKSQGVQVHIRSASTQPRLFQRPTRALPRETETPNPIVKKIDPKIEQEYQDLRKEFAKKRNDFEIELNKLFQSSNVVKERMAQ